MQNTEIYMVDKIETLTNPESFHAKLKEVAAKAAPEEVKHSEPVVEEPIEEQTIEESESTPVEMSTEEVEETTSSEPTEESSQHSENDDYKNRKFIPKSRFNQEIEKRKGLEEQIMKEREERIRYQTQVEMLAKMQQQTNPTYSAPEMDLDHVDPLDSETHSVYSREIKQLKEELRKNSQQTKQMQYATIVSNQEQFFQKDNPDYLDAANYLKNIEYTGAREMFGDDRTAEQVVMQKYQMLMSKSLESGKSVPETVYKLAKAYGYSPKAEISNENSPAKTGSNLKAINTNMKKSSSISGLGNGAGMGSPSVANIKAAYKDPSNPSKGFDPAKFHQLLKKA